jgi:hypothetical protein
MDPKAVIESYVDEVARRLPARTRRDVGLELRDLLNEELANASDAEGRAPDEKMALDLLNRFGSPDDVADRYRPSGPTIIRGQDARMFVIVAFSGVALQWALTLMIAVFLPQEGDIWLRLARWWPTMGLGAFWWPGIMITAAIVGAYVREQFPRSDEPGAADSLRAIAQHQWVPRPHLDPDRINRPLWAVTMGFFAIGLVMLAATPALIAELPDPPRSAFALDEEFVRVRGPWLLALWAAQYVVFMWVLVEGRWRRPTRLGDVALKALSVALVAWIAAAGPMLATPQVDQFAKLFLLFAALIITGEVIMKLRRERMRVGPKPPA